MLKPTLIKAARASGALIKEKINSKFLIEHKEGPNNLVTEVDKASETLIMNIIREEFPDHYILSEEIGALAMDSSYKWIIDPIDGTVNFANGIPLCCVSIAIEKDGMIIMGAVYNPMMNEFFFAEKNQGAYLNDQRISVSEQNQVKHACLVDLCWVAAGRFDGYYEHKLQAWDSAAGFLMVEEAGGKVTDFKGDYYSPYQPHLVATNGKIHDELLKWISNTHQ